MRLSRRKFEVLVLEALESIPDLIRERMQNVDVVIEDWPTDEQLVALGMAPDELLFGLYEGTPLIERGITVDPMLPDKITIFQGPLEDACETDREIEEEIRKTVVHEVAHHFGIDEERLEELGYE
ncbi:MAG: metallopeptidase family protein [Armatimonadetes bacterium]|nr:metallopeptidase family protein [Armatimonadota bacterium]